MFGKASIKSANMLYNESGLVYQMKEYDLFYDPDKGSIVKALASNWRQYVANDNESD